VQISKKVDDFLKQTQICVLATTGPGQAPHAIPMWYLYRDGKIVITTSGTSQKSKNVARNGEAMVVFDKRESPYFAVMIKGHAEIGPGLSRDEEYGVALRYLGEDGVAAFMQPYDAGESDDATIVITPTKIIEYGDG
jgi:PPOX class probable F420-dependent enzyme